MSHLIPQLLGEANFPVSPMIERCHRIGILDNFKAKGPRPILVKFHYFQDKLKIMKLARNKKEPLQYKTRAKNQDGSSIEKEVHVYIYLDFSAGVVQRRREFDAVKKKFCDRDIEYGLIFPSTLLSELMSLSDWHWVLCFIMCNLVADWIAALVTAALLLFPSYKLLMGNASENYYKCRKMPQLENAGWSKLCEQGMIDACKNYFRVLLDVETNYEAVEAYYYYYYYFIVVCLAFDHFIKVHYFTVSRIIMLTLCWAMQTELRTLFFVFFFFLFTLFFLFFS